jgi:hypothetical protein
MMMEAEGGEIPLTYAPTNVNSEVKYNQAFASMRFSSSLLFR